LSYCIYDIFTKLIFFPLKILITLAFYSKQHIYMQRIYAIIKMVSEKTCFLALLKNKLLKWISCTIIIKQRSRKELIQIKKEYVFFSNLVFISFFFSKNKWKIISFVIKHNTKCEISILTLEFGRTTHILFC
jgi:hypothetical protein